MRTRGLLLVGSALASQCAAFYTPRIASPAVAPIRRPVGHHDQLGSSRRPLTPLVSTRRPVKTIHAALPLIAGIAEAVKQSPPIWNALSNVGSLLVLALIVAVHELGHFIGARSQGIKVDCFSIGFGPPIFSYKSPKDSVEYTIRAFPAGGFVSFPRHYEIDQDGDVIRYEDKDLLQNRPPWQQAIVVSAGVIANIIFSYTLLFGTVTTAGLPRPQFSEGPYIVKVVDKTSPAALAGLQSDDILLSVNGKPVKGDDKGLNQAVSYISTSGGGDIDLRLKRKGDVITKKVTPRVSPEGRASIGVQMAAHVEKVELLKAKDIGEAIMYASQEFNGMLQESTNSISRFTQTTSLDGLTGPLGIVQVGADLAKVDPLALVKFSSFISINLAVVNALPVPGLDGGQMVFVLIEMLRGKKLDIRLQNGIQAVAILILASLSLYLITGDLERGFTSPIQKALESGQIQQVLPPPTAK